MKCTERPDSIDVIIPVYNQTFALAQTLYAFARQIPPYNRSRIIVVDDGSEEPVGAVVEAYTDVLDIVHIRIPRSGRAAARNAGLSAADAEWIVFCDADRMPRPEFLAAHAQSQKQSGGSLTVGHVKEMYISNPEANRDEVLKRYAEDRLLRTPQYCSLVYQLFNEQGVTGSPAAWIASLSGNLSIPASWLREAGGFDEGFKEWGFEHMELGYRLYRKYRRFRYSSSAVNIHIAHPRGQSSYEEYMRRSHALLVARHREDEGIARYLDFMLGRISLRQFEELAGRSSGEGVLTTHALKDGHVRIVNRK